MFPKSKEPGAEAPSEEIEVKYPLQTLCEHRGRRVSDADLWSHILKEFNLAKQRAIKLYPAIRSQLEDLSIKRSRSKERSCGGSLSAEYDFTYNQAVVFQASSGTFRYSLEIKSLVAHEVAHAVVHGLYKFYGKSRYPGLNGKYIDVSDETLVDTVAISLLSRQDQRRIFKYSSLWEARED